MNNVELKERGSRPLALPSVVGVWDSKELRTAPKCCGISVAVGCCPLGLEMPSLALEIPSCGTVEFREVEVLRQPARVR